ncbi:hypothetical protein [Geodermatophilus sp. URMC 60]
MPYYEIAEAVDKASATVRRIAHRAREHVAARRPRTLVRRIEQQRVVDRFLAALTAGDVQGRMGVLAPGVVAVAGSGGLTPVARRPVEGGERVASALSHFAEPAPGIQITTPLVNGTFAARMDQGGRFDTAIAFVIEDGRITRRYAMRNPYELGRLGEVADLRR